MDSLFFVGYFLLPEDVPAANFCQTTQIFVTLNNEKNSIRCENVSNLFSEYMAACPIKAGINIFLCLRNRVCDPTTPSSILPLIVGNQKSKE